MKTFFLLITMGLASLLSASAQNIQPIDEDGLALGGYDVVAYFSNKALKGSSSYSAKYKGTTYYFSSAKNMNAFKRSPENYLPQYDGYCAWGVAAKDSKFPINPETFDLVDGKLYLFYNGDFNGKPFNTSLLWKQETVKLRAAADKKWPSVKSK